MPNPPGKLEVWLTKKAQTDLDEHVRPEIQALAKRGNVTPAEIAELRCNSWEWEHLVPAMNDAAFVAEMEHAIKNSSRRKQPFATYDEAVSGIYGPELLKRFKLASLAARDYGQMNDNIREALGQKETRYPVTPGDVAVAIKALEWYAANSLESMRAKVTLALIRGRATKTSCKTCGRMIFVVEDDRVPVMFCQACGGGCVAWPVEDVLP
jgi:hypothetical protein